jgi:hypothetical protein
MKKEQNSERKPDMLDEYDFSGGVRGKYADRAALYAEFAEEDRALAEEGLADYAESLREEDVE